jgi:hypothetical protein
MHAWASFEVTAVYDGIWHKPHDPPFIKLPVAHPKHLPNDDECRALLKIVTARYPQLKFQNAVDEFESFKAAFAFYLFTDEDGGSGHEAGGSTAHNSGVATSVCKALSDHCFQRSARAATCNIRSMIDLHFGSIHTALPVALWTHRLGAKSSTAAPT